MNSVADGRGGKESSSSIIIEGFICPECQQDLTNLERLQAHFELAHHSKSKKKQIGSNGGQYSSDDHSSGLSSVLAKAKTLINQLDQAYDPTTTSSESSSAQSSSPKSLTPNASSSTLVTGNMHGMQQSISSSSNTNNISYSFMKQYYNANQKDGVVVSHTSAYRKLRDNSIGRYVVQTNKLLITLDKLVSIDLTQLNDETKRDAHYKSVVAWIDDKDVRLCPNCAKSFSVINRKHHCRLCGAIMCNKCSQFISFSLAKQITDPDSFTRSNGTSSEFKLRRSDSITSVNSYFFKDTSSKWPTTGSSANPTDQIYIRLCFDCGRVLEKKHNVLKDKAFRPVFDNLYNELHSIILESERLYPTYKKMAESLFCGETFYQLGHAEELRSKLIRLYQQIDQTSSTILKYGLGEEDVKVSSDQMKLQRNLRFHAVNYLKEYSFQLPQLPSSEEYERLSQQRQRYLIEEKRRAEDEQRKVDELLAKKMNGGGGGHRRQASNTAQPSNKGVSIDNVNGWIPSRPSVNDNSTKSVDNDALRIQIKLVESYLNDAIKHNKMDEARMLEQNLNDLLDSLEIRAQK